MQLSEGFSVLLTVLTPLVGAYVASQFGYGLIGQLIGGVIALIIAMILLFELAESSRKREEHKKPDATVEPESQKKD